MTFYCVYVYTPHFLHSAKKKKKKKEGNPIICSKMAGAGGHHVE